MDNGYVKPKVCQEDLESTEQMKKIVKETALITQDMLQRMMANFHRRLQLIFTAQGGIAEAEDVCKLFSKVYSYQSFLFHLPTIDSFKVIKDWNSTLGLE